MNATADWNLVHEGRGITAYEIALANGWTATITATETQRAPEVGQIADVNVFDADGNYIVSIPMGVFTGSFPQPDSRLMRMAHAAIGDE